MKIEHCRTLYKQRNHIERIFGHLKINRAIATRYDQLPAASEAARLDAALKAQHEAVYRLRQPQNRLRFD